MSVQQSSSKVLTPASDVVTRDSGLTGDGPRQSDGTSADVALDTGHLARLLSQGEWEGSSEAAPTPGEVNVYEGHVALALDAGVLPDMAFTLDLLTSSHDLFDVPALCVASGSDDVT